MTLWSRLAALDQYCLFCFGSTRFNHNVNSGMSYIIDMGDRRKISIYIWREVFSMRVLYCTLTTLVAVGVAIATPTRVKAQFVFGQPIVGATSAEASPFNAFFIPSTSSTSNFGPPVGFYHYFFLPQYTAAYSKLYSDFEYDLPEGDDTIGYEFAIIRSFKYE